ncbi:hypothetical protein MAM1_0218c08215 [Mucor ambiguus]|uniref:Uncharacterized protein n=1 Tax=Mucor ambiguus TaxID=91626 RepID=A0A0C9LWK8_9FUNG|nr:hypothetical protein MAM1_0218c08215 [Mucor ambiguus]
MTISENLKQNNNFDRTLHDRGSHHTDDEDDIGGSSDESESGEEELNESKKQHMVLETDAQTKRLINAVVVDLCNEDACVCEEIY